MKQIFVFTFLLLAILNLSAQVDLNESRQKQYSFAAIYDSAAPEYYKDQATDSAKIVAALASQNRVEISETYNSFNKLIVPNGRILDFGKSGNLKNVDTVFWHVNSSFEYKGLNQIFKTNVVFLNDFNLLNKVAKPEIFGAVADSSTDCTKAIQTAINYFPTVLLTGSNYVISNPIQMKVRDNDGDYNTYTPHTEFIMSTGTSLIQTNGDEHAIITDGQGHLIQGGRIINHETINGEYMILIQTSNTSLESDVGTYERTVIKDIILVGNMARGLDALKGNAKGIKILSSTDAAKGRTFFDVIDNVTFLELDTAFVSFGIGNSTSNSWTIRNSLFNSYHCAIWIEQSSGNMITSNYFQPSNIDYISNVLIDTSSNNLFYSNYFWDVLDVDTLVRISSGGGGHNVFTANKSLEQGRFLGKVFDFVPDEDDKSSFYYRKEWDLIEVDGTNQNPDYVVLSDTNKPVLIGTYNYNWGSGDLIVDDDIRVTDRIYFEDSDGTSVNGYDSAWLFLNAPLYIGTKINGTTKTVSSSSTFRPYTTLDMGLGNGSKRWNSLYTDNITDDGNKVTINTIINLKPGKEPKKPKEGDIYCNSKDHELYFYDGTNWEQISP